MDLQASAAQELVVSHKGISEAGAFLLCYFQHWQWEKNKPKTLKARWLMQVTICYLKMIRETNSMAVKNGLYHVPRELDISRKTKRKAWELKALIVFNNLPEKNNCWITKDRRAYV